MIGINFNIVYNCLTIFFEDYFFQIIFVIVVIWTLLLQERIYEGYIGIIYREEKYRLSVQYYFENGLPLLLKANYFNIRDKSTSNHELIKQDEMEISKQDLKIISNIEDFKKSSFDYTSCLSVKAIRGLMYMTESDVQGYVKDFMYDVFEAAKLALKVKCVNEITLMKFRSDIWIVMTEYNFSPLCVLEIKKPSTVTGYKLVEDPKIITQVFNYMMSFDAFDGVYPHFAIVTTYNEWNILCFDDEISREVLFNSVSDSDTKHYENNNFDAIYDSRIDYDNDEIVTRKLIETGSITCNDKKLMQYLVSIFVKCYNKRTNGSTNSICISLLQKNRIILKATKESFHWIKLPERINKLSFIPPLFNKNLKNELFLLRDYYEGTEGKAWLGCTRQGQLVVVKIPIMYDKEFLININKECQIWNILYNGDNKNGVDTAGVITLNGQHVLLMPYVFCCIHNETTNEIKFNTTMQPKNMFPMKELLLADMNHVNELDDMHNIHIKQCNPQEIAKLIIEKLANKRLIHYDIAWRHIGVRPIFNKYKKFSHFVPVLIDVSSVKEADDFQTKDHLIQIMIDQLK